MDSFIICNFLVFIGAILPNNAIDTSTKHDYKHWNPIISIIPINQHITLSVQVYLQCTYLFPHCSFLWMSSIPAHHVSTVLQVPIQATQHKDDTNPSCISFVLFRVISHYYFLYMFLHPITPSANSTSSTNWSHPTQGWYPIPLCRHISFLWSSGCFTKLRHFVLTHPHSA